LSRQQNRISTVYKQAGRQAENPAGRIKVSCYGTIGVVMAYGIECSAAGAETMVAAASEIQVAGLSPFQCPRLFQHETQRLETQQVQVICSSSGEIQKRIYKNVGKGILQ